ncbi:hypothetical protein AB0D30_21080 [Streptomyces sp. NPDC048409]|uniref:hypothetical protein n=1 Tax=Streptomyces sp. NPDC048409 TaxID=3154723 RepID=UPI00342D4EC5
MVIAGGLARRLSSVLGLGPTTAELLGAALERLGRKMGENLAAGLRDPRPLTAEELANLDTYCACAAHRSFSALYDDQP